MQKRIFVSGNYIVVISGVLEFAFPKNKSKYIPYINSTKIVEIDSDGNFEQEYEVIHSEISNYFDENGVVSLTVETLRDLLRKNTSNSVFSSALGGSNAETSISSDLLSDRNSIGVLKSNPINFKIVGGFYYPRKAINPDWISEILRTDIPENQRLKMQDIEDDLDLLISNNINTIRVVIQYNLTTFETEPLFDSNFNINQDKNNIIVDFLSICKNKGIKVFTQTNFGYEGQLYPQDINEMQNYVDSEIEDSTESRRFNDHIDWMCNLINSFKNTIILHKTFNEPDGFGTWSNPDSVNTVLRFLYKTKQRFIKNSPHIPYLINAVDHVNFNLRFPELPKGMQSIYEISDWAVFNSYYWADNGSFEFVTYKRQWDFMMDNNFDNKPIMMSEFGFPSNYENQSPGEESFVPENGQFDRPQGLRPLTPHNENSQERGIKEGVFYSEQNNAAGVMCWSLFQHINENSDPNFFQDSFGLIASDASITPSFNQLKRSFKDEYSDDGIRPFSLLGGSVFNGAHINGFDNGSGQGFIPEDSPAGVYMPENSGYISSVLDIRTPFILSCVLKQTLLPLDNGVSIGIDFVNNGNIRVQFEDFSNRYRLFIDGVEVAATDDIGYDFGLEERTISFDLSSRFLDIYVDGVKLNFMFDSNSYNLSINQIWYQSDKKIICNGTTSPVNLIEAYYQNNI